MKLLLLCVALAMGPQAGEKSQAGAIAGRVTTADGTELFQGISVMLAGPLSPADANLTVSNPNTIADVAQRVGTPGRVNTDSEGRFEFRGLAPGEYVLWLEKEGYFAAVPTPGGTATSIVTAHLTVAPGVSPPNVRMVLVQGGIIRGTIRDPRGVPAPNALVLAYQPIYYSDGREILEEVGSRRSDDRGEYRFYGLAPGKYYIAVAHAEPGAETGGHDWCCKTYYPGVQYARAASPLILTDGGDLSSVNIVIVKPPLFNISGRVDSTVERSSDVSLSLTPDRPDVLWDNMQYYSSYFVGADGSFKLGGVPSGYYALVATQTDTNGERHLGRLHIDVGASDMDGVEIKIRPGPSVEFHMFLDGQPIVRGSTTRPRGVQVHLRSKGNDSLINPRSFCSLDASGECVVRDVAPGSYSFTLSQLPVNSYVADIRYAGQSVYDEGVVVSQRSLSPVDIQMISGGLSIRGTVHNPDGTPAPYATVVVVPPLARRQNAMLYRTVRTNVTGDFRLNNIPSDDYRFFAWERILPSSYLNANFAARYESQGRDIRISPEQRSDVDLILIPWKAD